MSDIIQQMEKLWKERRPGYIDGKYQKKAAVLLPLLEVNGALHLLFEVRAGSLRSQPGEICFPGGAIERGETAKEAAVRETAEELLLEKAQIEIIAPLDKLAVPANLTIYPFLGRLRQYKDTCSKDEVERIFTVPLTWFLEREPEIYHTRIVTVPEADFPFEYVPDGEHYRWRQGQYDVLFYTYGEFVIWGMTAKLIHSFVKMYRADLER